MIWRCACSLNVLPSVLSTFSHFWTLWFIEYDWQKNVIIWLRVFYVVYWEQTQFISYSIRIILFYCFFVTSGQTFTRQGPWFWIVIPFCEKNFERNTFFLRMFADLYGIFKFYICKSNRKHIRISITKLLFFKLSRFQTSSLFEINF